MIFDDLYNQLKTLKLIYKYQYIVPHINKTEKEYHEKNIFRPNFTGTIRFI